MRRHRYFIVEHQPVPKPTAFSDMVIPIHHLLGTYHWMKLDDQHIFVTGHYEVSKHSALQNHPKTSILPVEGSGKSVKSHLSAKVAHWNALASKLQLDDNHTCADVAEAAEAAFGVMFGLNR